MGRGNWKRIRKNKVDKKKTGELERGKKVNGRNERKNG
jgi:hypothetical protein